MRLVILLLSVLFSIAYAKTLWHELDKKEYDFNHYIKEYHKNYNDGGEFKKREMIFKENLEKIKTHNRLNKSWKMGVNHMSDWSEEEFRKLLGHKKTQAYHFKSNIKPMIHHVPSNVQVPTSLDWRDFGAVTPVKDQGRCGSCWTFATIEAVESQNFMVTGSLVELSEQQVASCSSNPKKCGGSGGCEGGTAEIGFSGIIEAGGVSSEWVYPYNSHDGTDYPCNQTRIDPYVKLSSYVKLPNNSYDGLMHALATIGPIAISVDASAWQHYESGVFGGCNATAPTIDHAVQAVGYGVEDGQAYWLVRNSWTPSWGESGYIRIPRSDGKPHCAFDPDPCDGTACQPCPAKQQVCGACGILSDSAYPIISS